MSDQSHPDHTAAHAALRDDSHLGPIVERNGPIRLEPADDFFVRLTQSVVRQQISMTAADAIFTELADGVTLSPHGVRNAQQETLRAVGLSRAKARTLTELATAWDERGWNRAYFDAKPNDEVLDELTGVRGIGPWTAKMALMFGLARPDVLPIEDLGIRRGMQELFDEDLSREEMEGRAEAWRPYRSIASLHIWARSDP